MSNWRWCILPVRAPHWDYRRPTAGQCMFGEIVVAVDLPTRRFARGITTGCITACGIFSISRARAYWCGYYSEAGVREGVAQLRNNRPLYVLIANVPADFPIEERPWSQSTVPGEKTTPRQPFQRNPQPTISKV